MTRELITSWNDYQTAIDRLLALASHRLRIYDEDLAALALETPARQAELSRLLQAGQADTLQIAVRNAGPLRHNHPRLLTLATTFGHLTALQETPPSLAHLRDSMLIADERNALVRFERNLPRSKLLIDEPDEVRLYIHRFEDIWAEGGEPVGATTLGL